MAIRASHVIVALVLAMGLALLAVPVGGTVLSHLGDRVWVDTNSNGIQDAGENGFDGVTVQLYDCNDTLMNQGVTSGGGFYGFDIVPGSYRLKFVLPDGYAFSPTDQGDDTLDSDADANGWTVCITLGAPDNTWDAGLRSAMSPPGISITKSASKDTVSPYEKVTYTYTVKNTGGVPLTNVTVTDDGGTPDFTGDDFVVGSVTSLAPGATKDFTATVILPVKMCMVVNNKSVTVGELITQVLGNGDVKVVYIQSRNVVDNTYGKNAVGYIRKHNFSDLVGSDCAGFRFTDNTSVVVLDFNADYIHNSSAYPSGYGTLGVSGGDGKMIKGSASNIQSITTSLTQNLNQSAAYYGFTVNSPPPPEPYPGWDYINSYTVVVKAAAFGTRGFGKVTIPYVHNSPSKLGINKIIPQPCSSRVTNLAKVVATANGQTVTATAQATVCIVVPTP